MQLPTRVGALFAVFCLNLLGCDLRAPHAVVVIDDPSGIAQGVHEVTATSSLAVQGATRLRFNALTFPASVTVAATLEGPSEVWVQAFDAAGTVIAQCTADVDFSREAQTPVRCDLGTPCDSDAQCDDGAFCNGAERCRRRICLRGSAPCKAAFDCLDTQCIEESDQCTLAVRHERCASVVNADGSADSTFCSPSAGCVRGRPCYSDGDCQDSSFCNGSERCRSGQCFPGAVPHSDDSNPCTFDGCTEGEGVIHVPAHGSLCTIGAAALGVCEATLCTPSRCGDDIIDPRRGEECDDADRNSDLEPDHCRADCRAAYCGDGVIDAQRGESCDDGNERDDDSCLTSCTQNVCGDGLVNVGVEECDDGNLDDDDACLVNCIRNVCGDGIRAPLVEECDDGNSESTDACVACMHAVCGDGLVHTGVEVCDDGDTMSGGTGPGLQCRGDCGKVEVCGDALIDAGESCDDANSNPNDACHQCKLTSWDTTVILGIGENNGAPVGMRIEFPEAITHDDKGIVYFSDASLRIWRYDPSEARVTHFAGTAHAGYSGDGGPAAQASFSNAAGLAADSLGNVFFSSKVDSVIRKIDRAGIITTVAGTGVRGYSGDGGPATLAMLNAPIGIAVDGNGVLYICDAINYIVRKVDTEGIITTVAGNPELHGYVNDLGGIDALSPEALFDFPTGIALSPDGSIYISDYDNHRVRKLDFSTGTGILTTFAGTGSGSDLGDGRAATQAILAYPEGLALDDEGNLYISDWEHHRVRKVNAVGIITTVAGRGFTADDGMFSGDGALATAAQISSPVGLTAMPDGSLLIADSGNSRLRKVDAQNVITTAVGGGSDIGIARFAPPEGLATSAWLDWPFDISLNPNGEVFFTERLANRVSTVSPQGTLTPVALRSSEVPPSQMFQARFRFPCAARYDASGNLYVLGTTELFRFAPTTTTAGHLRAIIDSIGLGYSGDGGPSIDAQVTYLYDLHIAESGDLYLADAGAHVIRKIDLNGYISTVAGSGVPGYAGDGGPATSAMMREPTSVITEQVGPNAIIVYIADTKNHVIRKVDVDGTISTIAGSGVADFSGDGGPALEAGMHEPMSILLDTDGTLLVADHHNGRIRRVDLVSSTISTFAGNGELEFSGDFRPAAEASFSGPIRMVQKPDGALYVTSSGIKSSIHTSSVLQIVSHHDNFVRRIGTDGIVTTIAGAINPGDGSFGHAFLGGPSQLIPFIGADVWLVADGANGRVRLLDLLGRTLSTVVGYPGGLPDAQNPGALAGIGRLLRDAEGIAFDEVGNTIFVSEYAGHTLRAIDVSNANAPATWTITTYAGALDTPGHQDGAAVSALLHSPAGLALDPSTRTLYVADSGNHVVRAVNLAAGTISTFAGVPRSSGNAQATLPRQETTFTHPQAIALSPSGNIYVADTGNHRVRRIAVDGATTTVVGTGIASSAGLGSPASSLPVDTPMGLVIDSHGNLFVGSRLSVRRVSAGADGVADGSDEVSTIYGTVPRTTFPESVMRCISGISNASGDGRLYVLDACQGFLVQLERR